MGRAVAPAGFENIGEADEIRLNVGLGMGQRVSHAGLSSKMDNPVEPILRKHAFYGIAISEISTRESPRSLPFSGLIAEKAKARLFQRRIVIVINGIEPHNVVAAGKQMANGVKANKTCGAGYKDLHVTAAHRCRFSGKPL